MSSDPQNRARLCDLAQAKTEKAFGLKHPDKPYIGLEHLASRSPDLIGQSPSTVSDSTNSLFIAGDILFGKLRPYLRKSVAAPFPGYCSTDLIVLRPAKDASPAYVAKVFQSDHVFAAAVATSIGTKMPRTSWRSLRRLEVYCPPLIEQQRIAKVLDTLDEAIRKTAQVIAKLKQMKQGLLNDLLTRGVDENGELRDPQRHPEQFKDSPLGLIPKGWNVMRLQEVVAFITDYRGMTPPYTTEGIPVLSAENIGGGRVKSITKFVSDKTYRRTTNRGLPEAGDVIFTTEAPVAEVARYPATGVYRLTRRLIALRPNGRAAKGYLYWVMRWMSCNGAWDSKVHGSTVPRILKPDILSLAIPIAPLDEQVSLAKKLDANEQRVDREKAQLQKLQTLKRGLMDDLLTGRARVPLTSEST